MSDAQAKWASQDAQEVGRTYDEKIRHEHEVSMAWLDVAISYFSDNPNPRQEDYEELKQMEEQFRDSKRKPVQETTVVRKVDWEDPERLLQGEAEYSEYTWEVVSILVHELIHQRQAELNPEAFPELSSPALDNIDLEKVPRDKLRTMIDTAHVSFNNTTNLDNLFYPVIEGMAVTGSFYVMTRLMDDLTAAGQPEIAAVVRKVRSKHIRETLFSTSDRYNYHDNYNKGVDIMKKLYKKMGIEESVGLLTKVDLEACQGIREGSVEYESLTQNPELIPIRAATI